LRRVVPALGTRGIGLGRYSANRTYPEGWLLAGHQAIEGQLLEQIRGICPDCQRFTVDLGGPDGEFTVVTVAPGLFDVYGDGATRYGQIQGNSGSDQWDLIPPCVGADHRTLAQIAAHTAKRFG
jgi:hypothetical protein